MKKLHVALVFWGGFFLAGVHMADAKHRQIANHVFRDMDVDSSSHVTVTEVEALIMDKFQVRSELAVNADVLLLLLLLLLLRQTPYSWVILLRARTVLGRDGRVVPQLRHEQRWYREQGRVPGTA